MYALSNWLIVKALTDLYELDTAEKICVSWVKSVITYGFREMYNPITGEGLGSSDYSASTIIVDSLKTVQELHDFVHSGTTHV